ncbi:asparaginase [Amycolatopsis panacis]|uniref:Asparaginase n=1 Tax=Amycolatopsis panacis TaxID=2340917 RepID=A0A419I4M0_9PSEU|nr:asparaginase [Amycolatopsis panacis]RJQ85314.1 asparaginase [Amycolatopsis panacis]
MTRPRVAVAALGGTISIAPGGSLEDDAVPRLSTADLLGELGADLPMEVTAGTLAGLASASMSYAKLAQTRQWGIEQIEAGAVGLVVVQGTDTLEETAYFFELTWPFDEPVVVTGAMRNPSLLSPDGPANLLAALTVAADPRSRGRGALVAFNDDVHAARWVRKAHSSHLEAFSSAPAGPLGMVVEQAVHYFHRPAPRPPALPAGQVEGLVPVLESGLGDSGELLSLVLNSGARGVVLAATGVGHVSAGTADVVRSAEVPIVVATRTGAGPTFRATYGSHGSESSLIRMGATMAGWLCPRKSRALLQLLLAAGVPRAEIEQQFRLRGDLDR